MNVYLDESGDLGWNFEHPYRQGGSSRFLTIALLICPSEKKKLPIRIVKNIYRRKNWSPRNELKAINLENSDKVFFSQKATQLCQNNEDIKIATITVKKENVRDHIRLDPNKLYNYMIKFALLDYIHLFPRVAFIPDIRTIKVKSGNSLVDYLQTELWFSYDSTTKIDNHPTESKNSKNLQFIDFVANIVWKRHESNHTEPLNHLAPSIFQKHLFF